MDRRWTGVGQELGRDRQDVNRRQSGGEQEMDKNEVERRWTGSGQDVD